jgi:hypothetical protein
MCIIYIDVAEDNPFSEWSGLIHKPVYSIDGKKLGFLRKIMSNYMIVGGGLINLTKYFIPIALAESVSKKGIRLKITAYEAHLKYSYSKMKNTLISLELVPQTTVEHRRIYDRFQTLRYSTNRNRLAAIIALVSGILFLLSGYKANIEIYYLIREEVLVYTAKEFWTFILIPIGILALFSQLGGITVLIGAGLFAANRVMLGKFMIMIGTGQGIFTIGLRIFSELSSGKLSSLENNYVMWFTSSAVGLGILFAIISQSISKGKGEGVMSKAIRFVLRRK